MAYRDELEAAQARVEALERELAQTKNDLALVRTSGDTAIVRGNSGGQAAPRWLGGPLQLAFTREIDGEVPERAYTELVEAVRIAIGNAGTTTVLPGSLAWSSQVPANSLVPSVSVYVTARRGRTTIRAEQKLGQLAGVIYGAIGGGVGGGAIVAPIAATAVVAPLLAPVAALVWLGGTFAACRRLYRSRSKQHAARLERLVDELAAIADRYLREPA